MCIASQKQPGIYCPLSSSQCGVVTGAWIQEGSHSFIHPLRGLPPESPRAGAVNSCRPCLLLQLRAEFRRGRALLLESSSFFRRLSLLAPLEKDDLWCKAGQQALALLFHLLVTQDPQSLHWGRSLRMWCPEGGLLVSYGHYHLPALRPWASCSPFRAAVSTL